MDIESSPAGERPDARLPILEAAKRLIAEGGVAALTTRAVAAAAGIQAPTLYRLFGDKRGLLNAVAEHGLSAFIAGKEKAAPHPDPVQDLSEAWDGYVAFGLANAAVFAIINEVGAPEPPAAALAGIAVLRRRIARVAHAGRLRVPIERAVALVHAAGVGTVATMLASGPDDRDPQLAILARDAVLTAILVAPAAPTAPLVGAGIAPLAIALAARMNEATDLSPGEALLLGELLGRLSR